MRIQGVLLSVVVGTLAAAGPASAAADVEGVWEFQGGKVAVQPAEGGTFKGTVLTVTQFADCPHPPGELMWTGMTLQPDGQYWGGHQWYRTSGCARIGFGRTAWRVLRKPDGTSFLRVCFAPPERPELQPTIAADGTSTGAPNGCRDSDLLAPADTKPPTFTSTVTLPKQGKKKCLSRRAFRIRLKEPKADALATASVFVNGKRVRTVKGAKRIRAGVNLTGLPKGRYTVKIVAKTVLGRTITGTRKYRTCAKKQRGSGRIRI